MNELPDALNEKIKSTFDDLDDFEYKLSQIENIEGFLFSKDFANYIRTAYPGDMFSPERFIKIYVIITFQDIVDLLETRLSFSMSGAMRWPWSQEARIHFYDHYYQSKFFIA